MEFLNNVWIYIVSALGGLSVAGIVAAVIYGALKGAFSRTIQKLDVEKINEKIADKQMERIKKVSFTQNIQPIVEEELKKVTASANECIKKELQETQKRYDNLILVLEKFYAYFDDSLVSDSKKAELKEALETAKEATTTPAPIEVAEVVVEPLKDTKEVKEKPKKAKIER